MPEHDSDPCQAQQKQLSIANQELRDFESSFVPGEMTDRDKESLRRLRNKARAAAAQLARCREIHGEAATRHVVADKGAVGI